MADASDLQVLESGRCWICDRHFNHLREHFAGCSKRSSLRQSACKRTRKVDTIDDPDSLIEVEDNGVDVDTSLLESEALPDAGSTGSGVVQVADESDSLLGTQDDVGHTQCCICESQPGADVSFCGGGAPLQLSSRCGHIACAPCLAQYAAACFRAPEALSGCDAVLVRAKVDCRAAAAAASSSSSSSSAAASPMKRRLDLSQDSQTVREASASDLAASKARLACKRMATRSSDCLSVSRLPCPAAGCETCVSQYAMRHSLGAAVMDELLTMEMVASLDAAGAGVFVHCPCCDATIEVMAGSGGRTKQAWSSKMTKDGP